MSNAQIIRDELKVVGYSHSNKWWQKYLLDKHGRRVTQQQLSALLGRIQDRPVSDCESVHTAARNFILACRNDVEMAKRILLTYAVAT